eukprot:COSAG06_NODE_29313_length_558_cov_5625.191721_1_plen_89_part_10
MPVPGWRADWCGLGVLELTQTLARACVCVGACSKMFRQAALAIKKVDTRLLVGGPATSGCRWLESLHEFTKATNTPIDFLSTHSCESEA